MIKLKLTPLQENIMRLFFIHSNEKMTARAVSKYLKVSQAGVSKALINLEKQEFLIVKKDKETKRLSIELNGDNEIVLGLKRVDNLKQLFESGFVLFLKDNFPGANTILFGSYSSGEDTLTSDIDIAVIGYKESKTNISKFQKELERTINIQFYENFEGIPKNLSTNILNGITLTGHVGYGFNKKL